MATDRQRAWNGRHHHLGRSLPGQRRRRLTPQQIDEIRQATADGASLQDLAARYGVSVWTIRRYRTT
jgi:DNA-binding CsgD family transcriptional regulator